MRPPALLSVYRHTVHPAATFRQDKASFLNLRRSRSSRLYRAEVEDRGSVVPQPIAAIPLAIAGQPFCQSSAAQFSEGKYPVIMMMKWVW